MLKFSKGGKAKLHEDDLGLLSGEDNPGLPAGEAVEKVAGVFDRGLCAGRPVS